MKLIPYDMLQKMLRASPLLAAIMKKRQAQLAFYLQGPRS